MHNYTTLTLFLATVWFFYLAGQFFSLLLRAYASVNSKLNGIVGYEDFFRRQGIPVLCRLFASILVMMYWTYNPDMLGNAALVWAPQKFQATLGPHPLTLNPATAGIFGYAIDSLLDKGSIILAKIPGFEWLHVEVAPGPKADPKL